MSSSTSSSNRFYPVLPFVAALLTAAAAIAAVELSFRQAHGVPLDIVPGMTRAEFQWKVATAEWSDSIFVVGDSRAGWGFSEGAFAEEAARLGVENVEPINAGLAGTPVEAIVRYLLEMGEARAPQTLIVNYSPAGFLHWVNDDAVQPISDLKRQDVIDDRVSIILRQWIYTFGRTPAQIWEQVQRWRANDLERRAVFVARNTFPDGFHSAVSAWTDGSPLDVSERQLTRYDYIIRELLNGRNHADALRRKESVLRILERAQFRGWDVVLVRLPIGDDMRALEAELDPRFQFDAMAAALDTPSVDFNEFEATKDADSFDQSHMTPESTRMVSAALARYLWENARDVYD